MKKPISRRRGFALMLVLIFNVIFLALLAASWRQISGMLQIETRRVDTRLRDRAALPALAWALRLLENEQPATDTYVRLIKISVTPVAKAKLYADAATAEISQTCIDDPSATSDDGTYSQYFKATYQRSAANTWTVTVAPATDAEISAYSPPVQCDYTFHT